MGTTFSKTFFHVMRSTLLDPANNNASFTRLGVFGLRKKGDRLRTPITGIHVNVAVVVASNATFAGWVEAPAPVDVNKPAGAPPTRVPQFGMQNEKSTIPQIFTAAVKGPSEVKWGTQVLLAHMRIENLMHMVLEHWKAAKYMNVPGYPDTRREALMLASRELARLSVLRLMKVLDDVVVADTAPNRLMCDFRPDMKPARQLPEQYPRDLMSAIT
jgi:hypothetical protein